MQALSSTVQRSKLHHSVRPRSQGHHHPLSMAAAPNKAVVASKAAAARRAVICLGDSHTRGFYGASWVRLLHAHFPNLHFINAGHDGEPSECIAARLPALLAAHPQPAAVLIFSGSNDCIAQENQGLQDWYMSSFRLSTWCTQQNALDNLEKMLQLVQQQAPQAKVIVINLPIMVEDPQHAANIRTHKYSRAVVELVARKYPSVSTVDFQAACRQHMEQHSPKWQQASQQLQQHQQKGPPGTQDSSSTQVNSEHSSPASSSSSSGWVMTVYSLAWNMTWSKLWQSLLWRQSWDAISAKQGLLLLTDQVHINDTAARILADLVRPLLQAV